MKKLLILSISILYINTSNYKLENVSRDEAKIMMQVLVEVGLSLEAKRNLTSQLNEASKQSLADSLLSRSLHNTAMALGLIE